MFFEKTEKYCGYGIFAFRYRKTVCENDEYLKLTQPAITCSKLTIEHISHLVLVFPLLTLSR